MNKKKSIVLLALILLLFTGQIHIFASPALVRNQNVNGKYVQSVIIDFENYNIDSKVVTAHNRVNGAENMYSMISRNKPLAAINGNFFDAYNSLVPYNTIISNGRVINLSGDSASFFIDNYGNPGIDKFTTTLTGYTKKLNPGEKFSKDGAKQFSLWYVNHRPNDRTGVYLYTPEYGDGVSISGGTTIIVDKNNVITNINKTSGYFPIRPGGYTIHFGPDSINNEFIDSRFQLGHSVHFEQNYSKNIFKKYEGNVNYSDPKIETMVSAGPLLVENGLNVANIYSQGMEDKISKYSAQRSAIGITGDNKVILVSQGNSTAYQLANIMISLGCKSAMNLDGGASSALYANGNYVKSAGRNLNNMLMFFNNPKPKLNNFISLYMNQEKTTIPADYGKAFFDSKGRTMVPLRFISENMGHNVEWNPANNSVLIDDYLEVFIGSNKIINKGIETHLESQTIATNNRTYVPVRFITEALSYKVAYERNPLDSKNVEHKVFIN